jgi:Ca2+-transporting ATPase
MTTERQPPTDHPWSRPVEEIAEILDVSVDDGLSEDEVRERRKRFGPNQLREAERRSIWELLIEQFKSLVIALLAAAGVAALLFGHTLDAAAIAVVIFLNTAIGFWTEYGAMRSMEALREMGDIEATVARDGELTQLHAREIVPGDIVHLSRGDVVPADLRLVDTADLEADESALTGESVPVGKSPESVSPETELAERTSMLFRGTVITRGEATAITVATGMDTELGEISEMVDRADRDRVPLEKRLDRLGRQLVWIVLAVAALVGLAGAWAGRDLLLMVETSIALAVAAVPEGLPIVATVALSYGMWQMKRQNALIRYLPSVETLGTTTTICVDKTGTLTENRMSIEVLATPDNLFEVRRTDQGHAQFFDGESSVEMADDEQLSRAVEVTVLANEASEDEAEAADPMEVAMVELGEQVGRPREEMLERCPQVRFVPFDTEINLMATIHEVDQGYMVAVQGAPEDVLDHCTRLFGRDEPLDSSTRDRLRERADALAADGYRVIGLATRSADGPEVDCYENLAFAGFVGLMDPPREDVSSAIEDCHRAGVRSVMVTGDHPETARFIAEEIGLIEDDETEPLVGEELEQLADDADRRRERLLSTEVLARVTPSQKLDLIDLLAEEGETVAMTGDGVNDAPALQSADIGIAMGDRGTQVAREAADMILLDDAFPTIVQALERGRIIFENIRKFVVYLLSGNIGEILLVGVAAALGVPLPLLPLQILYLNVLNDVFPALALGVGPGSGQEMDAAPRSGDDTILERRDWEDIGVYGAIIALAVGGGFGVALGPGELPTDKAVTVSFLSLSIARLLHVFNMRRADSGVWLNEISKNPYVWGALALDVGLLVMAVYIPLLAGVLSLTPPGWIGWCIVIATSVVPLLMGQLYLALRGPSR